MANKACHCCNGSGVDADDQATGEQLKSLRLAAGISQKDMAKELGISPSMLVFLEAGRRRWTVKRINQFKEACAGKEES